MGDFNELVDLISQINTATVSSGEECGREIKKFHDRYMNLTEEEKMHLIIDYFKNPPTEDDEIAIKEFKNRHGL